MFENFQVIPDGLILLILAGFGVVGGFILRQIMPNKKVKEYEDQAEQIVENAKKEAANQKKEAELQAKDEMIKMRQEFEKETKVQKDEHYATEKRLRQREENLDKRVDMLELSSI